MKTETKYETEELELAAAVASAAWIDRKLASERAAAVKPTITQTGDVFTVRDASGALIALAIFAMPRRYEDCIRVMRERAEFVCRFS